VPNMSQSEASPELAAGAAAAGRTQLAAPNGSGGASAPGPQVAQWAGTVTERVVGSVAWVRSRTTVPVVTVLRALVYGLVVIIAVLTAAVLGLIAVVRIWDAYVPVNPLGRRVWLGYVVIGGLLFLVGAALLARRASAGDKP